MVGAIGGISTGGAGLSAVRSVANAGHLGAFHFGMDNSVNEAVNTPAHPSSTVHISAAGRTALDSDNLRNSVATLSTNSGVQGMVGGSAAQSVNGTAMSNSSVDATTTLNVVNALSESINVSNQNLSGSLQSSGNASGNIVVNSESVEFVDLDDLFTPINTPIITLPGIPPDDRLVALLLLALLMRQTEQTAVTVI